MERAPGMLAGSVAARVIGALVLLVSIIIAPAFAMEPFPSYYRVDGVAADDRLNVRAEPNASAAIVDALEPDAQPVEVLETVDVAGRPWGRLALGEGDGWVAMRFLAPVEVELISGTQVPAGLQCSGTEPFWGVKLGATALEYSAIDQPKLSLPITGATSAAGRSHRFALVGEDKTTRMTAILSRGERCSDGMSDANYGWRIDLLTENRETQQAGQLEGCCRLRR